MPPTPFRLAKSTQYALPGITGKEFPRSKLYAVLSNAHQAGSITVTGRKELTRNNLYAVLSKADQAGTITVTSREEGVRRGLLARLSNALRANLTTAIASKGVERSLLVVSLAKTRRETLTTADARKKVKLSVLLAELAKSCPAVPISADMLDNGVRFIDVYTDASVRSVGNLADWIVGGLGVHWPQQWHGFKDVSMRISSNHIDVAAAEMLALIEAMKRCTIKQGVQLRMFTDSRSCVATHLRLEHKMKHTKWMEKFTELMIQYEAELAQFEHHPTLTWVKGHSGLVSNAIAHGLAHQGQARLSLSCTPLRHAVALLASMRLRAKGPLHAVEGGDTRMDGAVLAVAQSRRR